MVQTIKSYLVIVYKKYWNKIDWKCLDRVKITFDWREYVDVEDTILQILT